MVCPVFRKEWGSRSDEDSYISQSSTVPTPTTNLRKQSDSFNLNSAVTTLQVPSCQEARVAR